MRYVHKGEIVKYRKIIFIDPATVFGWAIAEEVSDLGSMNGAHIISSGGVVVLPTDPGPRVAKFWNELGRIITPTSEETILQRPAIPTFVAWEEAAFSWHGAAQSRMYGTWEGILLLFCEVHNIPYMTVNGATIKAYAKSQGFYNQRKPKPRQRKHGPWAPGREPITIYNRRVEFWENEPFDAKPLPRPEWKLASVGKMQNNEVDARWGLEYIIKQLKG